jgi:hypothetical protein
MDTEDSKGHGQDDTAQEDDAQRRDDLERDLEDVEERRSAQRTRGSAAEQFTAPGGEGQRYRPRTMHDE